MRVLRDEFFIRKDFAFYDCGLAAVVHLSLIHTYDLIRRFTFRADAEDPVLARLKVHGHIVASVGQTKLAALAGVSRQTMNEHIAKLKKLGWVDVHKHKDQNRNAYYVLGQMVSDSKHKQHEVFFADAWMNDLWEFLQERTQDEFGKTFEFKNTEVEWRVQVVREFITAEEDSTEQNTGCNSKTAEQNVACRPNPTGVVGVTRQTTSAKPDTEEDNSQVENFEVDKGEGPVASLPSSPAPSDSGLDKEPTSQKFPGKSKVPWRVADEPTLSESGEYPSVLPPPSPIPKWMQQSPGIAVGDGVQAGPVPKAMSGVHVDALPTDSTASAPRNPDNLAAIVKQAGERGRKVAEQQLQKAKAREVKLASLGGKPIPVTRKRQLTSLENQWKELMDKRFPGTQIAGWEGKERGQVWNLVEKYTGEIVEHALQYLVEQWDEIRTRMLKGRGGVPSVGFLLRFHDVLVIESQRWTEYRQVKKQVDDWYGGDPYKPNPPQELHQRYLALRKEMADLGLPV